MTSGTFTSEYQKGTLVPVLTKGLKRGKVLAAKALAILALWTIGYALCTLVTYGYTAFFWDNGIAQHLWFAAFLYYLFGVWIISVMVLFSTLLSNNTGVLMGTGAAVLAAYLLSMVPGFGVYLPLYLTDSLSLLTGALGARSMGWAAGITCGLILIQSAAAALAFRKRSI
jgi:ABC-2 type transport system permease protein